MNKWFRQLWQVDERLPLLYAIHRVRDALARGEVIYVVEGERDCKAIEAAGAVGTTNPYGALHWTAAHSELLQDGHIIVVADDDHIGWQRAARIASDLRKHAQSVKSRTSFPKPREWLLDAAYGRPVLHRQVRLI